ncbi:hypothetical protein GCM10011511_18680 [Puia dinghuensis]|uniref:VIT domain-containing protein n=2 Tax=Puia dinghuensis TaxID=1792502 RepID=A0A8J2UC99_9BACT|nr:hypothetical protein GCM10011511_18680 [Puia dinghuensis]
MPSLSTDGKVSSDVYLQKLEVDVSINGVIATTTWTMTFRNSTRRILEGELNFPLPQGTSVSRYALDINGKMREAVPVEKEKATQVFENTERRRIDPGLLEKVDGNTFRTRIYPINPEGVRTVRIGYEQELSWEDEADLRYRLPLAFTRPIESFSIHIAVAGTATKPRFDENTGDALQFGEWQHSWSATKEWKDYTPDRAIAIRIPQLPGEGAIQMQAAGNHYFFAASVFPTARTVEKPLPHQIALLWDVSLSGMHRDVKKELELLDTYFSRLGNVEVNLVEFSNTVGAVQRFSIHNGDWQSLKKTLQNAVFDGGTQFGALNLAAYPADEYLLFSDGHSSFGSDQMGFGSRPVYAIASSADADFPFLQSITERSGGELINLNAVSLAKGRDLLCTQSLHFLGVMPADGIEECYPSVSTPVTGALMVAGMVYKPVQNVVLLFGYGKTVTRQETVALDYSRQQASGVDLARVWAQKKIAELDTRYEENFLEIRHLGRSYGIVTRNTSLVVLENINDYIAYEIDPPAELREEYDRLLKGRQDNDRWRRRQVADHAEEYFNELLTWWKGEAPKAPVQKEETGARTEPRETRTTHALLDSTKALLDRASGVVANSAAPGDQRRVIIRGLATTTQNAAAAPQYRSRPANMDEAVVVGGSPMDLEKDKAGDAGTTGGEPGKGSFTVLKTEANTRYLDELKAAAPASRYAVYLRLRKDYLNTPLFYFHTAEFFLSVGEKAVGVRILSNIAEIDAENYELYKMMGYKLKELGETREACATFRRVLEWRPFEPQSYRDYGLALEDAGRYQHALDTLYLALTKNYDVAISGLYPGIEETLIPEINELIARHKGELDISGIPRKLLAEMPVDMRVVLNWNQNSTDIDLWVTDPDNERCFYGHRFTAMGGRISHDFTQGLGPEQFLLKKAVKGRYKVEVNYYGDTQVKLAGETTLLVEVYTHYGTPQQQRSLVTLQMKPGSNGAVYVGDFEF